MEGGPTTIVSRFRAAGQFDEGGRSGGTTTVGKRATAFRGGRKSLKDHELHISEVAAVQRRGMKDKRLRVAARWKSFQTQALVDSGAEADLILPRFVQ